MRTPIRSLLWVLGAAFLSLPAFADVNILTNPGFEDGTTTGWAARSCTISAVTGGQTDTYCAYVTNRTAAWNGIKQSILGKVNHGQTVSISGWVRLPSGAGNQTLWLKVEQKDGQPNTRYIAVASGTGRSDQWTRLSGQFTLNVTGTLTSLDIYFETASGTINFYLDDAEVLVPDSGSAAAAQINPQTRRQTVEGFGAAGAWYEGTLVNHPQKNTLYNILFGQLGLDIYRLRNTYNQSGGADYMNRSAQIIAAGEASLGRPLKILISAWSPPASLKSNDSTVRGTLKKNASGNFMYSEYAQWWADSVQAWVDRGINPNYISIQNEPDWEADWDTCRFNPTQNASTAGYNLAFDAVYNALYSRMGATMPKMIAPESTGFNGAAGYSLHQYLTALNDHSKVYGYAHHLYNINAGDNPDNYLSAMTTFNNNWGHKPLFQTEYEKATNAWPDALNMALLLHNSLTVEQVSAYLYWDLFWGNSGGLVTLTSSSYTINNDYYGFKHFSAFIHSGWQRIDTSVNATNVRLSAYISPDNKQLTAVIINTSDTTAYNLSLTFSNTTLQNGTVYRTTQTQNCALIGNFNPAEPLTLPARSITTVNVTASLIPAACRQVQEWGYRLPGDLDGNCYVGMPDMLLLAELWLNEATGQPGPLKLDDFAALSLQWLTCNDPQNTACIRNW